MRRPAAVSAFVAGALAVVGLSAGCSSPDITAPRVEDAVGPAFANLYALQQALLGRPLAQPPAASASCRRNDRAVSSQGAGDDWVCQLVLVAAGRPTSQYTYELNVKANGCYEADGPPTLVGGRTLTAASGQSRVNPLFAFDGCFDGY